MTDIAVERLGAHLETWIQSAPDPNEVGSIALDAQDALIEAGMVQFSADGWAFKLHEKHPEAPRAQFKLMIRGAPGVDTNPAYYGRFVLPSVLQAGEAGLLDDVTYVLGYPKAGTPIAAAFKGLAEEFLGVEVGQLQQEKITYPDGTRELGDITSPCDEGEVVLAVDDTATGGDTKIEGWKKITERDLSYAGLVLIVERDPLGSAIIRQRTGAGVHPSMHWLTVVQRAAKLLDLPDDVVQKEIDYSMRLYEWNVANDNLGNRPDPTSLK